MPTRSTSQLDVQEYSLVEGVRPVIILGAGRSGTKFLRGLLSKSSACCHIPVDIGYVWKYGNEELSHDVIPRSAYDEEIGGFVRSSLVRMARVGRNGKTARYVVEKSIPNTMRVDFVDRVVPDARYIHIVRDGRDVVESAVRCWREPPDSTYLLAKLRYLPWRQMSYGVQYAKNMMSGLFVDKRGLHVWGPRYPGIEEDLETRSLVEVCARQWQESVERADSGLDNIPQERKRVVHYEDLVSGSEAIRSLCAYLNLPDEAAVTRAYDEKVRDDSVGSWTRLPAADRTKTMDIIQPTLDRFGYQ